MPEYNIQTGGDTHKDNDEDENHSDTYTQLLQMIRCCGRIWFPIEYSTICKWGWGGGK